MHSRVSEALVAHALAVHAAALAMTVAGTPALCAVAAEALEGTRTGRPHSARGPVAVAGTGGSARSGAGGRPRTRSARPRSGAGCRGQRSSRQSPPV